MSYVGYGTDISTMSVLSRSLHFMTFISMLELGEKAAKPVTTVWDWLSAFGSVKPLDSFYKGLWRFNICKVKPRDICFFFYTGPQAFQHLQMWNHKIFFRETSGQFQAVFVVTKNRFWVVFFLSQDTIFSQLYQVFFYAHTLPDHKHCIVTKTRCKIEPEEM